jgi:hypothetical protein
LGDVIIKNPEIGMTAYFSANPTFQWDSAGLAQPIDIPAVMNSKLGLLYPNSIKLTALQDARELVDKRGRMTHVVEAWAMQDRKFDEARKKCQYVIESVALCVNDFMTLSPSAVSKK